MWFLVNVQWRGINACTHNIQCAQNKSIVIVWCYKNVNGVRKSTENQYIQCIYTPVPICTYVYPLKHQLHYTYSTRVMGLWKGRQVWPLLCIIQPLTRLPDHLCTTVESDSASLALIAPISFHATYKLAIGGQCTTDNNNTQYTIHNASRFQFCCPPRSSPWLVRLNVAMTYKFGCMAFKSVIRKSLKGAHHESLRMAAPCCQGRGEGEELHP